MTPKYVFLLWANVAEWEFKNLEDRDFGENNRMVDGQVAAMLLGLA